MANFTNTITYNIHLNNLLKIMDARTQRRLRREAVKNIGYKKFLKKHTYNKNIAAREERMLKRRDLREKCLKKEAEKKAEKKWKGLVVRDMEDIIELTDRHIHTMKKTLREIFERTKFMQSAHFNNNDAEFNYNCYKIKELCNKHLGIMTGALCERK